MFISLGISRETTDFIADGIEPYHSKYNPVERGKRMSRQVFAPLAQRLQLSETLPRWSVLIEPLRAGPAPAE